MHLDSVDSADSDTASRFRRILTVAALVSLAAPGLAFAGQVRGKVAAADGSPLPGASVSLTNPLVGYSQQTTTGKEGAYLLYNVPDNPYHLIVTLDGFRPLHEDVDVRGSVPVEKDLTLVAAFEGNITVSAEKEPVALESDTSSTHNNFQSVFGGTHVVPPRAVAARVRYTF